MCLTAQGDGQEDEGVPAGFHAGVRALLHPHRRPRGHRRNGEAAEADTGAHAAVARRPVPLRQRLLIVHLVRSP